MNQPNLEADIWTRDWTREKKIEINQKLDALCLAIAEVPERFRDAIVGWLVWGDSCREIAARMGEEEQTVSTHIRRAWQRMNEYCEEQGITLNWHSESE